MIREDAIVILKDIQDNLEETSFLKRCAIDMAIEALKEQGEREKEKAFAEHLRDRGY